MANLLSLPNELKEIIIQSVDGDGLKALRATCREMCDVANKQFALVFFSRRYHVVSEESLRVLVDITSHQFFGKFVGAVTINAIWPVTLEDDQPKGSSKEPLILLQNTRWKWSPSAEENRLAPFRLLLRAFKNIRINRSSITCGVSDIKGDEGYHQSLGLGRLFNQSQAHYYTYDFGYTLMFVTKAATVAKLALNGINVELTQSAPEYSLWKVERLGNNINSLLSGTLSAQCEQFWNSCALAQDASVEIDIQIPDDRVHSLCLSLEEKSLMLRCFNMWVPIHNRTYHYGLIQQLIQSSTWLPGFGLRKLAMNTFVISSFPAFRWFLDHFLRSCLETLEDLILDDVALVNEHRWSEVISFLSTAPNLRHFLFSLLRKEIESQNPGQIARRIDLVFAEETGEGVSNRLKDLVSVMQKNESSWERIANDDPKKWGYFREGKEDIKRAAREVRKRDKEAARQQMIADAGTPTTLTTSTRVDATQESHSNDVDSQTAISENTPDSDTAHNPSYTDQQMITPDANSNESIDEISKAPVTRDDKVASPPEEEHSEQVSLSSEASQSGESIIENSSGPERMLPESFDRLSISESSATGIDHITQWVEEISHRLDGVVIANTELEECPTDWSQDVCNNLDEVYKSFN